VPITQTPNIRIHDITEKRTGDFYRFSIGESQGKFYLIIEKKDWHDRLDNESLSIQTTPKRLEQLANEILSHLKKEARIVEWKPTMQEFEAKLREVMGEHGIEFWFIDWVRVVKTFESIRKDEMEQIKRIYKWLHGNREWLYK